MGSRARIKGHPYIPSYMDPGNGLEPCVVCGDAATGYHYRCMTCEGCKGFFRRTIQKDLKYFCKGVDHCSVAKSTRNQCQKCRYNKCVEVGMAVDLVLSENQRQAKRKLIEENRERKKLEEIRNRLREAALEEHPSSDEEGEEQLLMRAVTNSFHRFFLDIKRVPIKQEESTEQRYSCDQLLAPFVKIAVQFGKSIPIFAELNEADKTILLTSSWFELLLLFLCLQYDASVQGIRLPGSHGHLTESSLDAQAQESDDCVLKTLLDCAKRVSRLGMDGGELACIAMLLVMDPERVGLSDGGRPVEVAQDRLLSALKHGALGVGAAGVGGSDVRRFGKVMLELVDLRTTAGRLQTAFVAQRSSFVAQLLGCVVETTAAEPNSAPLSCPPVEC